MAASCWINHQVKIHASSNFVVQGVIIHIYSISNDFVYDFDFYTCPSYIVWAGQPTHVHTYICMYLSWIPAAGCLLDEKCIIYSFQFPPFLFVNYLYGLSNMHLAYMTWYITLFEPFVILSLIVFLTESLNIFSFIYCVVIILFV
jgi:hypothetical protein